MVIIFVIMNVEMLTLATCAKVIKDARNNLIFNTELLCFYAQDKQYTLI